MEYIITPRKRLAFDDIKELYRYRELLYFFSWRDHRVKFRQPLVGILWSIVQPLVTFAIIIVIFQRTPAFQTAETTYPLFVFSGIVLWQFLSSSLLDASNSLIENQKIISKVYFPRILLPTATIVTKTIDLCVSLSILAFLMVIFRVIPQPKLIVFLPLSLLLLGVTTLGLGYLLSALSAYYRDIRYVIPFFVQFLIFLSPVIYPTSILGDYSWLAALNPVTGALELFRAGLFASYDANYVLVGISSIAGVCLFVIGFLYFKKVESFFADIL